KVFTTETRLLLDGNDSPAFVINTVLLLNKRRSTSDGKQIILRNIKRSENYHSVYSVSIIFLKE
ncbi:MAG: hypothetical protein PVI90_09340, partial [Desulfobacteraceae bacterium]